MPFRTALAGLIAFAIAATAQAAVPVGAYSEHISRTIQSPPDSPSPVFQWTTSYDRYFDGVSVIKHVEIGFQFDADTGLDAAAQASWKSAAELAVEQIWGHKFALRDTANNQTYALGVDVTLEGYAQPGGGVTFDQNVRVAKRPADCASHPNDLVCRDNMIKWFVDGTNVTMAHEFGHMIGLYDEYLGGAVDKSVNPTLSNDGLMGLGALLANPKFYDRYFQQYADFMNNVVPFEDYQRLGGDGVTAPGRFVLVAVPEPSTWASLALGLVLLAGAGRRAARR